ncbi:MAG: zf-TFIIB domain-containing protein [Deltaproteobacteria bacterium]|nr:zf-TFIIB domain-containing protein [Deltaproteobacteria bacterium]
MREEVVAEIEIERCPFCKGMYLASGELQKLVLQELGTGDTFAFSASIDAMDDVAAYCPRCEVDMVTMAGPAEVHVDRCPQCGATFLDRSELAIMQLHEPQ